MNIKTCILFLGVMLVGAKAASFEPGTACDADWQCEGNLQCISSACGCVDTLNYIADGFAPCYEGTEGDRCDASGCMSNLLCNTYFYCECPSGLTFENSETGCISGGDVCDACDGTSDCTATLTSCVNGFCTCEDGYTWDGTSCITDGSLCEGCELNTQCEADYSECVNGYCVCLAGYTRAADATCVSAGLLNDGCTETSECSAYDGAVCDGDLCTCPTNWYSIDTCFTGALNDVCRTVEDCDTISAICTGSPGLCKCPDGLYAMAAETECYPGILTNPCSVNSQCVVVGSVCTSGTCSCDAASGYYQSGTQCYRGDDDK